MRAIFLLLAAIWNGFQAVRIKELRMPSGASHQAPLDCKYEIEDEQILYDVKWYKDGKQFFRCLPNGEVYEFPVEGVKLEHSGMANFGSCPLTLTSLTSKSTGEYKCEVSIDGPSFATAVASRNLRVIMPSKRTQNDIPEKGPDFQFSSASQQFFRRILLFHVLLLWCLLIV